MASSKKKITQDELRRLMNEQKKKCLNNVKKIESPLASTYDKNGTLHCVICESIVRSEAVWSIHLNSNNHKQNLLKKVKKKEEPVNAPAEFGKSSTLKRLSPLPPPPSSPKKLRVIPKNSLGSSKLSEKSEKLKGGITKHKLRSLSFDYEDEDDDEKEENDTHSKDEIKNVNDDSETKNTDALPEGFFDDPKLDAKMRNVEYKDPIEEEWEQFQKEIKEETSKAQQIIAEDQEEATTERQIDEIDEQIRNWSRVVTLEIKKEKVSAAATGHRIDKNQEELSEDDEEFEEFLDWRSKKSFDKKLYKVVLS